MAKLTEPELAKVLVTNPRWRLENAVLVRDFVFQNFAQAMVFVNRVADLAERQNHHPDITIKHNGVRLELVSHDEGGITERDADMARRLDQESFTS